MTSTVKRSTKPAIQFKTKAPPDQDWLAVSTDGFAQQNAGREPAHLVKELVQNSLDALRDRKEGGRINLSIAADGNGILIQCIDNGVGVSDFENIRTVFWTSKQDSHLSRGRMGRGFKEMLCLATSASVHSNKRSMNFVIKKGKRVIEYESSHVKVGTAVMMLMPWDAKVIRDLKTYFSTFIPPKGVKLFIGSTAVEYREPKHSIEGSLTTEAFVNGRWIKPSYKATIELVPTSGDETPKIYEMGIPVCSAEWERPYHINVLQRVPMNPNRDAVMTGYTSKLHKAVLSVIIKEMEADELRQEWVGVAALGVDESIQKEIISRGFGANVVRSVPTMGAARDHDADARELGNTIVNTRHLSSGFKEIISAHVPTSAQAVQLHERERIMLAAESAFDPADAYKNSDEKAKQQRKMIERVGRERVEGACAFAQWFCNRLLEADNAYCSGVKIGMLITDTDRSFGGKPASATWSGEDVLTLGIDSPWIFNEILGEHALSLLVHETAHNRAHHHGDEFRTSVERLTGRAARIMYVHAAHIKAQWGHLDK